MGSAICNKDLVLMRFILDDKILRLVEWLEMFGYGEEDHLKLGSNPCLVS